MTGEVKNIETTMNVRDLTLRLIVRLTNGKNFFTIVKALISQAHSEQQTVPDGNHRHHGPERALTDECVIFYVSLNLFLSNYCQKDYIKPKIDSEKRFATRSIRRVRLTSCGTWSLAPTCILAHAQANWTSDSWNVLRDGLEPCLGCSVLGKGTHRSLDGASSPRMVPPP
jgi:hypothetical protein